MNHSTQCVSIGVKFTQCKKILRFRIPHKFTFFFSHPLNLKRSQSSKISLKKSSSFFFKATACSTLPTTGLDSSNHVSNFPLHHRQQQHNQQKQHHSSVSSSSRLNQLHVTTRLSQPYLKPLRVLNGENVSDDPCYEFV